MWTIVYIHELFILCLSGHRTNARFYAQHTSFQLCFELSLIDYRAVNFTFRFKLIEGLVKEFNGGTWSCSSGSVVSWLSGSAFDSQFKGVGFYFHHGSDTL